MCGIVGVVNCSGRSVDRTMLDRMSASLVHRGPDCHGAWHAGNVGLAHRRLSVIDLSERGNQPMTSADGRYIIVYNGEVYNFKELREELVGLGYVFRSKTDTEVVLYAVIEWGLDAAVARFNGMFAFAVWDKVAQTVSLGRDRYGIKPLYYFFRDSVFAFASEIKALLQHPGYAATVSVRALNEYFSFQNVFSDLTLFEGIKVVRPATVMVLDAVSGSLEKRTYWDYCFREDVSLSENDCCEEVSRLFEKSVDRQLVSDVEVGSYLSSGVDSNSIASVIARRLPQVKTFTAGFDQSCISGLEVAADERDESRRLAGVYGTEHHEMELHAGDMARVMKDLVWHLEDLRVGPSYPNYHVAGFARSFVKVVFSGAGGDELFAGYPWRYYRNVVNDDFEHYAEKFYRYWSRLIPDRFKQHFYQPKIYPEIWSYQTKDVFRDVLASDSVVMDSPRPEDYINNSLYFESKTFLHGLLIVEDKLSMAHGLETRLPFLDNDLVDFAMKIPVRYKLRSLTDVIRFNENEPMHNSAKYFEKTHDGKIILRRVLANNVPAYNVNTVKQGFVPPDSLWFKGPSIEYIRSLLCVDDARIFEYIQRDFARQLIDEHLSGKENRRLLIWSLACFEWWLKLFMP